MNINFHLKKKTVVAVGLTTGLALVVAGFAFAGPPPPPTPPAPAPAPPPPPGAQLYNSTTVSSNYVWSYAFDATGADQFGNDITLVNGGGKLNNVVVSMGNFAPASESEPLSITLNIYNPGASEPSNGAAPGSLIATDTETITPPGTATGYTGTPPTYGIDNFNATFNFKSQNITLPDEVVYDITYDNTTVDTGLNVNLSYESSSVPSVGADTYPGYLFVATKNGADDATGGPSGEITCQTVGSSFEQYSTQPTTYGSTACGLAALPAGPGLLVPAVEFNS
jgi:hypothetical protein